MSEAHEFDAIVIGAGEAGATVASLAVESGRRVAMIYARPYGSTCLNTGCVPSKFLIHRARIAHLVRVASRYHVEASEPRVDLASIVRQKNEMTAEHRAESFGNATESPSLELVEGRARFASPREVIAGGRRLRSDRIFIATGMRPKAPKIDGLDRVPTLTNETLMELEEVPRHLVVVGGGYIACELGQAYRRFGAEVTIVQSRDRLLADEEPDVSTVLQRAFADEGIALLLGYRVARGDAANGGARILARTTDGTEEVVEGSHLLLAAGRQANTDALALDAAGVETDEKGFVRVNERLETSAPGIWAVGDVNGKQPFTRVCQEEAKVAYANAFEGARIAMEREYLGHAIFTDPEIGSVGMTEEAARERGLDVAVGLVTFDQVERAELLGETQGFLKYVVDRATHRLIGCHVIGPHAAELVYDAALVMRHGGSVDEIAKTVGIFPTLQEGMEGSARALLRRIAPDEAAGPLVATPITH